MKFRLVLAAWFSMLSLANAFAEGLRPEAEISVSEWADKYRMVSRPSPEPGPWRTDRVPYMREIMDRLSPSDPAEIVVLMKAAQGAGTDAGLNAIGCWMHMYPDSSMIVCPTIDAAKKFSRMRLDRMIEATPVLREIVAEPRSREASNNVMLKEFGSARDVLVLTGANSGVGLRSYPSRFVDGEEVDGWPADIDGEGNPVYLLIQRTAAFANRKLYFNSTPTQKETSNIYHWFQAGDRNEYYVPCPLCTRMQVLIFGADRVNRKEPGGLRWPKGEPNLVRYQCEHCGGEFEEWRKVEAVLRGEWQPQAPGNGSGKIRTYHVNALVYPYGWPGNKWENLATDWERDHAKPIARKAFVNLKEGLPWEDPTEAKASADVLVARCEAYGPELPAGVAVLLVGGDVQANRIEVETLGVGRDEESWSIDYRVLVGDTARPEVWAELDAYLKNEYLSELGISLTVKAACIDAGYQTEIVRAFCHERRQRNVWAIIGRDGQARPVWPMKTRKQKPGANPPPVVVGVDTAKENVYGRLKIVQPGAGFCHFPVGRGRDYFEMLTSEVRVPDYTGPIPVYHWRKKSEAARNEALDARVYAYAALRGLTMRTAFRLDQEVAQLAAMAAARLAPATVAMPAEAVAGTSWLGDRGKNWLERR